MCRLPFTSQRALVAETPQVEQIQPDGAESAPSGRLTRLPVT
jgi:hypothetical protein